MISRYCEALIAEYEGLSDLQLFYYSLLFDCVQKSQKADRIFHDNFAYLIADISYRRSLMSKRDLRSYIRSDYLTPMTDDLFELGLDEKYHTFGRINYSVVRSINIIVLKPDYPGEKLISVFNSSHPTQIIE